MVEEDEVDVAVAVVNNDDVSEMVGEVAASSGEAGSAMTQPSPETAVLGVPVLDECDW